MSTVLSRLRRALGPRAVSQAVYDPTLYDERVPASIASARRALPLVIDWVHPSSVVDVGCGVGAWLSVFRELGVAEVLGVDGGHVDRARLRIPPDRFIAHDLTRPLALPRTFDLACSVEVAEHLDASHADGFVASLTALAPVVLFSAAIPFQGGDHHVNEQWPAYWVERFAARGFRVIDCLRRRLWNDDEVRWWYAQNLLLFVREDALARYPALVEESARAGTEALPLVHPKKYLLSHTPAQRRRP